MSYDIYLTDPVTNDPLELDGAHHMRGGTYAMGGTTEAWLNITYNYADWYYRPGVFARTKKASKGIRTIYGMTGAESIPALKKAISKLESMDEPDVPRITNKKEHRKDRIQCLGNAVVPQQFYPVFQAIADIERGIVHG